MTGFGEPPTLAALITAARVLAHAPTTVPLAQAALVTNLLRQAESLGADSVELVLRALLTATGMIIFSFGDRSPQDEQDLEHARRIAEGMPRGSAERRFFEAVAERIEARLNWATDSPSPQDDGRQS